VIGFAREWALPIEPARDAGCARAIGSVHAPSALASRRAGAGSRALGGTHGRAGGAG
jgi:hypothetical protein